MTETYSKKQLGEITGRSPEWVNTVCEHVTPVETSTKSGREWSRYTLKDFIGGVEMKYKAGATAKAKLDDIKYEKAKDELMTSRGQLLDAEDVRFYLAEQNKRVIETLSGLSDQVDRKCAPEVIVLETIDSAVDALYTQMHEAMTRAVDKGQLRQDG